MAVIVEHRETRSKYVLLGTGFGAFRATKPNWFFGNLVADEQEGEISVVAVTNAEGEIGWFESRDLRVLAIDREPPAAVLAQM